MQSLRPTALALRSLARLHGNPLACRAAGTKAAEKEQVAAAKDDILSKKDVVAAIATDLNMSAKDVQAVVDALLGNISTAVAADKKVQLIGFGTFKRAERAAREGRNPKTGLPLSIAATAAPSFVAGKKFKDEVKASYAGPAK